MNIFGAITILVAVFGAFAGALFSAFLLRNHATNLGWLVVAIAGLASGYISLKLYFWLLRKLDNRAKKK